MPDISAACSVAREHAEDVDRNGRYPMEAMECLRRDGFLGDGQVGSGQGLLLDRLRQAKALGAACASTGLIFAMHHAMLQVVLRHAGAAAAWRPFEANAVGPAPLIASSTTELGTGGDTGRSCCHAERNAGGIFRIAKSGAAVSYIRHASHLLITARRDAEALSNDQIFVLVPMKDVRFDVTSGWNALGMRGTETLVGDLNVLSRDAVVLEASGNDIITQTMLPVSHLLWNGVWLGIAESCLRKLRAAIRKTPAATGQGMDVLTQVTARLQSWEADLMAACDLSDRYNHANAGITERTALIVRMNNIKLHGSRAVADIALRSLEGVGFQGYLNDGELSLAREVRDALSAPLMVSNFRISENQARLLALRQPKSAL